MVSTFPSENQVLEHFQCPFQEDDDQMTTAVCSYHVHFKSILRSKCPFGHSKPGQLLPSLRDLPPYICHSYLAHGCRNGIADAELPRCTDGLHPSLEDLIDLEHLHQKMAFHILKGDQDAKNKLKPAATTADLISISPDDNSSEKEKEKTNGEGDQALLHADDQCCICLESVSETAGRLFGIAEGCAHVFCSDCLITWSEGRVSVANRNTHRCPTCRELIGKVLVCQRLPASTAEKKKLFDQQYQCLDIGRLAIRTMSSDDDDDDDDDDDEDEDEDADNDEDVVGMAVRAGRVAINFSQYRMQIITHLFNAISELDHDNEEEGAAAPAENRQAAEPMDQDGEAPREDSAATVNADPDAEGEAPRSLLDEPLISFASLPSSSQSSVSSSASDEPPPLENAGEGGWAAHWDID